MPAKGSRHSEAARARIAEGTKRGRAASERKRAASKLTSGVIDEYRRTGKVHASLQPIMLARRDLIHDLVEDLGGSSEVTAAQRALIDGVAKGLTAADAIFSRFLETGDPGRLDGLATLLGVVRANLKLLGIERVPRDVTDLESYLAGSSFTGEEGAGGEESSAPGPDSECDPEVTE